MSRPERGSAAVSGSASVRVAATSANLGPGFDCLGLALALYDDVRVEVISDGLHFDVSGEGATTVPRDETHLLVRTLRTTLHRLGYFAPGLALTSINRIPHGRGLGSSAAAICAGILLARRLVAAQDGADHRDGSASTDGGRAVSLGTLADDAGVVALADELEGHPDNVAACLLGGATLAWTDARTSTARAQRLTLHPDIEAVVFIPPFESSTTIARGLLPDAVPHRDASANAARSALLVLALTARPELLLTATEDRLHQPYRASAMPTSAALMNDLRAAGLAATISGAGPTVLTLVSSADQRADALAHCPPQWRGVALAVDTVGALGASS